MLDTSDRLSGTIYPFSFLLIVGIGSKVRLLSRGLFHFRSPQREESKDQTSRTRTNGKDGGAGLADRTSATSLHRRVVSGDRLITSAYNYGTRHSTAV